MNISFAWTLDPLLSGIKTCTRRDWKERYFQTWVKAWNEGRRIHVAIDKDLRAGGKCVGEILLTHCPYREALRDMPDEDLYHEGNLWANKQEFVDLQGGDPDKELVVIRFVFTPDDAYRTQLTASKLEAVLNPPWYYAVCEEIPRGQYVIVILQETPYSHRCFACHPDDLDIIKAQWKGRVPLLPLSEAPPKMPPMITSIERSLWNMQAQTMNARLSAAIKKHSGDSNG